MSEYGQQGTPPGQSPPPPLPSEEIRYDLNGNPLPSPSRAAAPQQPAAPPPQGYGVPPPQQYAPPPPPAYAPPPPPQGYAPPPPAYAPPPQQPYGQPPPQQYGYGAPPGQGPPPGYAPPGAPVYGGALPAELKSKVGLYVGLGIVAALAIFVLVFIQATKPAIIDAPTAFRPTDSPDKAFTCTGPDGWETLTAGVQGSDEGGVTYRKGAVTIDITDSSSLSFMSDAMKSPAPMGDDPNMPAPPPPVVVMHDRQKNWLKEKYAEYVEQDPQPLQVPFGDTRISEWTAKAGIIPHEIHGYRVTMIGMNKAIVVDCHCPEGNWDTMKPVFLKVIQSIVTGSG